MHDVTLAVLAGGAGSRMGKPKGSLTLAGRPILDVLREIFQWDGPTMVVTSPGRTAPPGSAAFGREVVDPWPDGGPLVGICTALQHLQTDRLILTTVDMPGVGPDQLQWLMEAIRPGELGMMGTRLFADRPQLEPFPSIFCQQALGPLGDRLALGKRSVHAIVEDRRFVARPTPADWPSSVWSNLNYPADVATYESGESGRKAHTDGS